MADKSSDPLLSEVPHEQESESGFEELLRYTLAGYIGGLVAGVILDTLGFQRAALGQWLVRTLGGEAESIFEGFFALRQRILRKGASIAESYAWGKFLGMIAPWIIDAISRLLGLDVYSVEGFYIPYFYAMGDQIGANLAGIFHFRQETGDWTTAFRRYFRHPVMLASLGIILIVPVGLLVARLLGFSPTTQVATAIEIIASNLCWIPPAVGWLTEKRHVTRSIKE